MESWIFILRTQQSSVLIYYRLVGMTRRKNFCVGMRAFWYCTFVWLRSHLEHWRWWWQR